MAPPQRVAIFDGHNDVLLRLTKRGGADAPWAFLNGEGKGQLDLPMAKKGKFVGGLFAIFVPSTKRANDSKVDPSVQNTGGETPETSRAPAPAATHAPPEAEPPPGVDLVSAQKVTFSMLSLILRIERESQGLVRICRTAGDIRKCLREGMLAVVLHIEGAEAIDEDFALLDVLHAAGLRSLGPVWARPNAFGYGVPFRCPSSPDIGPGLTELGKELVRRCNRLGILVDVAHLNERGFWDVAAISDAPLVATHSNAHAISPHSRNLTDEQLAAIRASGGFVGVNFAVSYLRPDGRHEANTPLDLVVDHVDYLIKHLGEDGVGFGSDFDGARIPAAIATAAGLPNLVDALRQRGYGERLIEKVCYRNWLLMLDKTWGARAAHHRAREGA